MIPSGSGQGVSPPRGSRRSPSSAWPPGRPSSATPWSFRIGRDVLCASVRSTWSNSSPFAACTVVTVTTRRSCAMRTVRGLVLVPSPALRQARGEDRQRGGIEVVRCLGVVHDGNRLRPRAAEKDVFGLGRGLEIAERLPDLARSLEGAEDGPLERDQPPRGAEVHLQVGERAVALCLLDERPPAV